MSARSSCVYAGTVVHKRLAPKVHAFAYKVFSVCLDLDAIGELAGALRLFSHNRWNVLSFHDRDHGRGDGMPVAAHVRALLAEADLESAGASIKLLCYPRLFGFVFNPLSVYFCYGLDQRIGAVIYEVTNTFHERRSYIIAVDGDGARGTIAQRCAKDLYVSPFTGAVGSYDFHILPPGDRVVVGIAFRDAGRPVLKTHFQGGKRDLTDRGILALVVRHPLMTVKVVAGIHFEAARLWLKGVPLVAHSAATPYSFTVVRSAAEESSYV